LPNSRVYTILGFPVRDPKNPKNSSLPPFFPYPIPR
jgi:hypothetical protein